MANFDLSEEAKRKQAAAQGDQDAIKAAQTTRDQAAQKSGVYGQGLATPDELMKHNAAEFAKWDAESADQAKRGGVETADAVTGAGGIAGFFGGKDKTTHYTAGRVENDTLAGNRAKLDQMAAGINNRSIWGMGSQPVGPAAQIGMGPQDQMRGQQMAFLGQLGQQAAGNGPSAAQQMLKMGADRAQAAALSRAAAAGTAGARRQASFEAAGAIQDAAGQSAMLRAQEQQQAMGMMGGALQGARQQDIGLATDQAALNQQGLMKQADFNQQAAQTNLAARIEQQKQKDTMVQQYLSMGMNMDQAQYQAELQQAQFNADLLARQSAADKGVSMQGAAAGGQVVGGIAQAIGTIGAAAATASDERAKKNVSDADGDVEKFLDGIAAKSWDYKDPAKHGEGRRTGIMAQDAEKNSGMVFEHPDGTKMIDHGKAIGTSMAALANINKRLRKLEA
jgi:hypothetical protein